MHRRLLSSILLNLCLSSKRLSGLAPILAALVLAGLTCFTTNESCGSTPWQAQVGDVQLEAMPDILFRNRSHREASERSRARRYRTPFIVPMTPPSFTELPSLSARKTETISLGRPTRLPSVYFEAPESFTELPGRPSSGGLGASELLASHFLSPLRSSQTLPAAIAASEIIPATMFESKVVSVVKPNVSRLGEKIEAHNLNVQVAEVQLRQQANWTLDELEGVLRQLEAQQKAETLLTLYWRLLEPQDKWHSGNVASGEANWERFRQRLFETRVAWDIHPKAITSLGKDDASARFSELEQRIDQLERSAGQDDN